MGCACCTVDPPPPPPTCLELCRASNGVQVTFPAHLSMVVLRSTGCFAGKVFDLDFVEPGGFWEGNFMIRGGFASCRGFPDDFLIPFKITASVSCGTFTDENGFPYTGLQWGFGAGAFNGQCEPRLFFPPVDPITPGPVRCDTIDDPTSGGLPVIFNNLEFGLSTNICCECVEPYDLEPNPGPESWLLMRR